MTADQVCDAALARTTEFNARVPSTRSVMWHRINARQQQLFSYVADLEPELFGVSFDATLVSGGFDLAGLNPLAERITHIEILDPGSSAYAAGQKVAVVQVFDVEADLPPRATLRDFLLEQVGTDLDLVASVRIHYSKRPATVSTGATVLEFLEQFLELLVIDLTRHLLRKTFNDSLAPETKKAALALLDEEETLMLADLKRHCEHWRFAETSRFPRSQQAQPRPLS